VFYDIVLVFFAFIQISIHPNINLPNLPNFKMEFLIKYGEKQQAQQLLLQQEMQQIAELEDNKDFSDQQKIEKLQQMREKYSQEHRDLELKYVGWDFGSEMNKSQVKYEEASDKEFAQRTDQRTDQRTAQQKAETHEQNQSEMWLFFEATHQKHTVFINNYKLRVYKKIQFIQHDTSEITTSMKLQVDGQQTGPSFKLPFTIKTKSFCREVRAKNLSLLFNNSVGNIETHLKLPELGNNGNRCRHLRLMKGVLTKIEIGCGSVIAENVSQAKTYGGGCVVDSVTDEILAKPLQFHPQIVLQCDVNIAQLRCCNAVVCGYVTSVDVDFTDIHMLGSVPQILSRSADVMVKSVKFAASRGGFVETKTQQVINFNK
jgi:hypothetical protein